MICWRISKKINASQDNQYRGRDGAALFLPQSCYKIRNRSLHIFRIPWCKLFKNLNFYGRINPPNSRRAVFGLDLTSPAREHIIRIMKIFLATLIILIVIAIAAKRIDCPQDLGVLGSLNFHIDIFKSFSTATFVESALISSLTALWAIILVFWFYRRKGFKFDPMLIGIFSNYGLSMPTVTFQYKFIHWLTLHENSPSVF